MSMVGVNMASNGPDILFRCKARDGYMTSSMEFYRWDRCSVNY